MTRFDVAIVGGGLAGCSAALHARLKGASVILLERGRCGGQASGVNYGGVRQQGRHPAELPLACRSRQIWGRLAELVGTDCEFTATGHLKLARNDADMQSLLAYRDIARDYGIDLEILSAADLQCRYPYLGDGYCGASLCAADGQANPRLAAPAFARKAQELGVTVREHCELEHAEKVADGFQLTIKGETEQLTACRLINTAGAWGARVARWFGDEVDEQVMAPNMCVTEPVAPLIGPNLGICGGSIYLRQTKNGSVVFGAGLGVADADRLWARPLADVSMEAARGAIAMVPQLANVLVVRTWTGIEGRMPDGLPVLGESRKAQGLFHAFGFSGHGFQLGPAVGAVLSELCLDGSSTTPIDGLSLGRFGLAGALVSAPST
ncbi:sarcosine oxidase subunit beta [Rhizobium azibense]|uniref:Sarcosine oxidase subunit beta n=1 Tax=Rhizobium azibense TaxID=1136135 RepID=A0A4R3QHL0_9HYPH|nr:FAD-dependent oxidoreductase [Rhizobium azibense]TCU21248.1 sarcosine oxidase subunit beta [Rhizobium azibense]